MPTLTVLDIRNTKTPGRLADGGGLFFEITMTGVKRWLYRFKIDGINGMYIVGRYPELFLKEARENHSKAKTLVTQGINPAQARRGLKQENLEKDKKRKDLRTKFFENIALEWIEQQREGLSTGHARAVLETLKRDVFGRIIDQPIDTTDGLVG